MGVGASPSVPSPQVAENECSSDAVLAADQMPLSECWYMKHSFSGEVSTSFSIKSKFLWLKNY